MADVFLSYKSEDRERVALIAAALERSGFSVWWDPQIEIGVRYSDHIGVELEAAKAIVVVWSERSVRSDWVREEADLARAAEKLVPIRIDGAKLPPPYNQFQCADLSRWNGTFDTSWARVDARVRQLVDGTQPAQNVRISQVQTTERSTREAMAGRRSRGLINGALNTVTITAIMVGMVWVLAEFIPYRGNGRLGQLDLVCEYNVTAATGLSPITAGAQRFGLELQFEPKMGSDATYRVLVRGEPISDWRPVDGGSGDNLCLDLVNGTSCAMSLDLQSGVLVVRHDGRGGNGDIMDRGACRRVLDTPR